VRLVTVEVPRYQNLLMVEGMDLPVFREREKK